MSEVAAGNGATATRSKGSVSCSTVQGCSRSREQRSSSRDQGRNKCGRSREGGRSGSRDGGRSRSREGGRSRSREQGQRKRSRSRSKSRSPHRSPHRSRDPSDPSRNASPTRRANRKKETMGYIKCHIHLFFYVPQRPLAIANPLSMWGLGWGCHQTLGGCSAPSQRPPLVPQPGGELLSLTCLTADAIPSDPTPYTRVPPALPPLLPSDRGFDHGANGELCSQQHEAMQVKPNLSHKATQVPSNDLAAVPSLAAATSSVVRQAHGMQALGILGDHILQMTN